MDEFLCGCLRNLDFSLNYPKKVHQFYLRVQFKCEILGEKWNIPKVEKCAPTLISDNQHKLKTRF